MKKSKIWIVGLIGVVLVVGLFLTGCTAHAQKCGGSCGKEYVNCNAPNNCTGGSHCGSQPPGVNGTCN